MNKNTKIFWISEQGQESLVSPETFRKERPILFQNIKAIHKLLKIKGDIMITLEGGEEVEPSSTKYGCLVYNYEGPVNQYKVTYSANTGVGMYMVLDGAEGEVVESEIKTYKPTLEEVLRSPGRRLFSKVIPPIEQQQH